MAAKKKEVAKETPSAKKNYYQVKGDKLERSRRSCPKCGPGVFMAEHQDRISCGRCGYTEFKKK
ncbi:MAG: 30S ribosomal protein S27ae [Methanomassiliicoccales archaeon]|nr:30S ribosomal protein S27ae [Methanomassiliicoccales archaeon]